MDTTPLLSFLRHMFQLLAFLSALLSLPVAAKSDESAGTGEFSVSEMFGDHAVLQRDRPVAVWGTAEPGRKIEVKYLGATASAVADTGGKWETMLPPMTASSGGDLIISVDGREEFRASNVAVGEVWLCSGQSNMNWPVRFALNAAQEIRNANFDKIRLFSVARTASALPQAFVSVDQKWEPVTPKSIESFSAVCYYFGRSLHEDLDVPIGLIDASWGGSVARAWTSYQGLRNLGVFEEYIRLNEQFVSDPSAAERSWGRIVDAWWQSNDLGSGEESWADHSSSGALDWHTIGIWGPWQKSGVEALRDFNGIVWYRNEFELSSDQVSAATSLHLGQISQWDTVWLNGEIVGETNHPSANRSYSLSDSPLRVGKNLLAIRIFNAFGPGGGFSSRDSLPTLVLDDGTRLPLDADWKYRSSAHTSDLLATFPEVPWSGPRGYSTLYNGMIAPMLPYTIRGVAWYQGESDERWPTEYERMLRNLIRDWRRSFEQEDLPFLIVQLAGFGAQTSAPKQSNFSMIREAQRIVAKEDHDIALVTAIDLGEPNDIHPANKQSVGIRLATGARDLIYSGQSPNLSPCTIEPNAKLSAPDMILVQFSPACRIKTLESNMAVGFQTCSLDGQCEFVGAKMQNEHVVELALDPNSYLDIVRFCWGDSPICNLVDSRDLPIVPFQIQTNPQ